MNELEGAIHNLSLNRNMENGMTAAKWKSRRVIENQQRYNPQSGQYNAQQGQWGPTCYIFGNQGHLALIAYVAETKGEITSKEVDFHEAEATART